MNNSNVKQLDMLALASTIIFFKKLTEDEESDKIMEERISIIEHKVDYIISLLEDIYEER